MNRFAFANPALWLLCLAFLDAHALCSAEKPLIAIQFKIEAPDFRANLAKVLPKVEKQLTTDLADYFNSKFNFYEWTSALAKDPARLAALLTVSLKRGDRGSPNYAILLAFTAEIREKGAAFNCNTKELKPSTSSFALPLYSGSENQPTGKKEQLGKDVMRKIAEFAQDQAKQQPLADGFFSLIPFCRDAKPVVRLIVIPLSKDELRVEAGTQMGLHLCTQPRGEHLVSVTIPLTVTQDRISDEFSNFIQAKPDQDKPHFNVLSKDYDVSTLVSNALKPSLGLLMVAFNPPQNHTDGRHVTSP